MEDLKVRKCVVCEGTNDTRKLRKGKYQGKVLCSKHRSQVYKHGDILERTRFDRNTFIEKESFFEFICYGIKGEETGRGLIDKEDYELISAHKWRMSDGNRIITDIGGKVVKLHHLIMNRRNEQDGKVVDHINRKPWDNRRANLRIVTLSQNGMNRSLSDSANTSGYIGVTYNNRDNCWIAFIKKNNKARRLSGFDEIEDALLTRLKWELELFGKEFAPQRHLFERYKIGEIDNV